MLCGGVQVQIQCQSKLPFKSELKVDSPGLTILGWRLLERFVAQCELFGVVGFVGRVEDFIVPISQSRSVTIHMTILVVAIHLVEMLRDDEA